MTARGIELTWKAAADFESGLEGFIIQRGGLELARLPEKPDAKYGRPLFQGITFGDTPVTPLAMMTFTDSTARPDEKHHHGVIAVNGGGLRSEPAKLTVTYE
ncbi:MAG: hypothetical protein ACREIA_17665 [Opitutaceae bacterium]